MKRITALFLAIVLILSAAACGKSDSGKTTEQTSDTAAGREVDTAAGNQSGNGKQPLQTLGAKHSEGSNDNYSDDEEFVEDEDNETIEISQDEVYRSILTTLTECTMDGYDNQEAPERDIDYDSYPQKYDLRDLGVVTPVKNQVPWGTCWAFGTIAACETSILSEMKTTYKETPLDLSERHLAWFANMHLEDEKSAQNGEGVWHWIEVGGLGGGFSYTASSLLATGTGVALEEEFPYHGDEDGDGSEEDPSIEPNHRFVQRYELEESRILPITPMYDDGGEYLGLNETALYDIKDELLAGRGVAVSYNAEDDYYYSKKCTQYCGDNISSNHACCIVGWDDTVSRDSFNSRPQYGGSDKPEGDGAWIVKNSWGAETSKGPDYGDYGIKNKDGKHTGYFYLSYYDRTITTLMSFDFLTKDTEEGYYLVDQYDYLQSNTAQSSYYQDKIIMANEFEAEEDQVLRCISLENGAPGVSIHYEVSRIRDPEKGPENAEIWTSGDVEYRYSGYHRIDLKKPLELKAGEHYLVSFYQTAQLGEDEVYLVSFHRETNPKKGEADYYLKGIVNPRESWIYIAEFDQWIDWSELVQFYQTIDENEVFDNFSIKGYSDPI